MRKPAEVLELALSLLDENKDSCFMCCHLDWMHMHGTITDLEREVTVSNIRSAINYRWTLRGYLVDKEIVPRNIFSTDPAFRPYQVEFYTNLIATLKQE